ncbi:galactose-1-epimerase [Vibrio renipiscarius]|uniref:Aldose 1-epimerase n=1 Tax=Vibrio renipiscarius TaxID=1461322 RepID=A0A0C2JL73_9VIBR|nr:galactose-1-epimerase [Vibrio renipiscarius]KII75342.1 galactose-1-epimerase [Vibrio renipiscarius]KII78794.1 galactose-1-epimerase [Vibrio renipiscarius]
MTKPLTITMSGYPAYDGKPATVIELKNKAGMTATFMDIGATWLSCRLPLPNGELRELLLGTKDFEAFLLQECYMGALVGRYANRIAGGEFSIEGRKYQVDTNQAGNCLHGGPDGFDKRRWDIRLLTESVVEFSLTSIDGDQGFPGNMVISVQYALSEKGEVRIEYKATTDKATPFNLTNHAYFNLSGGTDGRDVRDHYLQVEATHYIPTTDVGIPLGHLAEVESTSFDFRQSKAINQHFLQDEQQVAAKGYDHCFTFDPTRDVALPVVTLKAPDSLVTLQIFTTKPGIQVYTGNWLAGAGNRKGGQYSDYAGVALETQYYPDSVNHPEWGASCSILTPDTQYHHVTVYQFSA